MYDSYYEYQHQYYYSLKNKTKNRNNDGKRLEINAKSVQQTSTGKLFASR